MTIEAELRASIGAAAHRALIDLDAPQRRLADRMAALGAWIEARPGSGSGERPRSLYVYGPPGRGKSWLADTFFEALPTERKTRVHVHGFFGELHAGIHGHRSESDAVERAIDDVTRNSRLLFFDELHVHDSGSARLLTRLLDYVFRRDLVVLATSNYAPADLLPDPIWRHIFDPGRALIAAHMDAFLLDGAIDYRTVQRDHTVGFAAGAWTTTPPADAPGPEEAAVLSIGGREFPVLAQRPEELWISFSQLCATPTSTSEYREWARSFSRWVVTGIPAFGAADAQAQQRFINVVDVLVDADVEATFVSDLDLASFLDGPTRRPDAFRMASRLGLLRMHPVDA